MKLVLPATKYYHPKRPHLNRKFLVAQRLGGCCNLLINCWTTGTFNGKNTKKSTKPRDNLGTRSSVPLHHNSMTVFSPLKVPVVPRFMLQAGKLVDEMDGRWVDLIGKDEDQMERW
ncbi:hypothetical protein F2Q69_00063588 [Brassica cretica]|uniref:Uncharacterized protein n=1 Tax=Brassica cretica TaxID=69181 RepID=A0A8S9RNL0_BRACR|nr:hypothetical protein F2Q69_00063588 [Brassica cretica]